MADIATSTATPAPAITYKVPTRRHPLLGFALTQPLGTIGLVVIVVMILSAIFADVVAPYDPLEINYMAILAPPSAEHWMGTDDFGRDIFSRVLYGARTALAVGFISSLVGCSIGALIGMISAYAGGWIDTLIQRVMDVILAFPSLLLALVLVAVLGPGLTNAMIAIAIVYQPHFARLTRAAVMGEMRREYVTAARVAGAGNLRLMFKTILPNCLGPLIVQATLSFSSAVLDSAALGFLGMGAQPPAPEWGTMLAEAREFILRAWWVVTLPGLAILVSVLAINMMGDGLRDALDPKLKRS